MYGPVTRLPNTTEARAKLPADLPFPMLTATLQTESSAAADGASSAGEFNVRPCIAPFQAPFDAMVEALGDQAPAPQNQSCSVAAVDGSGAEVSVAWWGCVMTCRVIHRMQILVY